MKKLRWLRTGKDKCFKWKISFVCEYSQLIIGLFLGYFSLLLDTGEARFLDIWQLIFPRKISLDMMFSLKDTTRYWRTNMFWFDSLSQISLNNLFSVCQKKSVGTKNHHKFQRGLSGGDARTWVTPHFLLYWLADKMKTLFKQLKFA